MNKGSSEERSSMIRIYFAELEEKSLTLREIIAEINGDENLAKLNALNELSGHLTSFANVPLKSRFGDDYHYLLQRFGHHFAKAAANILSKHSNGVLSSSSQYGSKLINLIDFCIYRMSYIVGRDFEDNESEDILEAPPQKSAPYKFVVQNGVVSVEHQIAVPQAGRELSVDAARAILESSGRLAASALAKSQLPELGAQPFRDLLKAIERGTDIIALGLWGLHCKLTLETHLKAYPNEMGPEVLAALMNVCLMVARYVAQFPEWREFNEAIVRDMVSDPEYIASVRRIVHIVSRSGGPWLTPEVKDIFKSFGSLLDSVATNARYIAAVVRTVQNFYSAIVKYLSSLAKDFGDKFKEEIFQQIVESLIISVKGALKKMGETDPNAAWLLKLLEWLDKGKK